MSLSSFLALFLASAINAGIPGPCIILTIARTAHTGAAAGIRVSAGIVAANAILAIAALAALVGLLTLPDGVYVALKWVGAAALLVLAFQLLRAGAVPSAPKSRSSASSDLFSGLVTGLSSPFNLIFYFALLQQFIPSAGAITSEGAHLSVVLLSGVVLAQSAAVLIGLGALRLRGGGVLHRLAAFLLVCFAASSVIAPIG